jgi:hypothetical protein
MKNRIKRIKFRSLAVLAASTSVGLSACSSWVQLTPQGEKVSLADTAAQVQQCSRVGRANVQTLGKILVVERGGQRLQDELLSLARNEAADLGGDTVVPESLIADGKQTFGVYRCGN